MNLQLAYSFIWFLKVATVLVNGVCEFDWEMLQSHTTDQPTHWEEETQDFDSRTQLK